MTHDTHLKKPNAAPALRTLLVALLLILTACGDAARDPAVGVWQIDPAATLASTLALVEGQLAGLPPEPRPQARQKFETMFTSVAGTLELRDDKSLESNMVMSDKTQQMTGTWTRKGNNLTMKTKVVGSDAEIAVIGLLTPGALTVNTAGTQQFMVFLRGDR